MPFIEISVNVAVEPELKSEILTAASKAIAEVLEKPVDYVLAKLNTEVAMSFGGTEAPCSMSVVKSIGRINQENNLKMTTAVIEILAKLGIEPTRCFLSFEDVKGTNWGFNNSTFAHLD